MQWPWGQWPRTTYHLSSSNLLSNSGLSAIAVNFHHIIMFFCDSSLMVFLNGLKKIWNFILVRTIENWFVISFLFESLSLGRWSIFLLIYTIIYSIFFLGKRTHKGFLHLACFCGYMVYFFFILKPALLFLYLHPRVQKWLLGFICAPFNLLCLVKSGVNGDHNLGWGYLLLIYRQLF